VTRLFHDGAGLGCYIQRASLPIQPYERGRLYIGTWKHSIPETGVGELAIAPANAIAAWRIEPTCAPSPSGPVNTETAWGIKLTCPPSCSVEMNCLHCRDGLIASKETCEATDIEAKAVCVERNSGHDDSEVGCSIVPAPNPNYEVISDSSAHL
jgi:hypothetical protein